MNDIDIQEIISALFGTSGKPVTEQEMLKTVSSDRIKQIGGMVFLPSGNGYLIPNDEQNQNGEK